MVRVPELVITIRLTWWARMRGWLYLRRAINRGDVFSELVVSKQGVMSELRLKRWLAREGYIRDRECHVWFKPEKKR